MFRFAALVLGLAPFAAAAQPAANITRDQFVQRAAENAGRRFDAIDTSHAGVVTRAQIHAFRQAHGGMGGQRPQ